MPRGERPADRSGDTGTTCVQVHTRQLSQARPANTVPYSTTRRIDRRLRRFAAKNLLLLATAPVALANPPAA